MCQSAIRYCTVSFIAILIALAVTHSEYINASACPPAQERLIVDAILNQSASGPEDSVAPMIDQLDLSRAIIPEPGFYRALATWYRGYQVEDNALKKQGIKRLRQVAKAVEDRYVKDTANNNFIVGMIKAYTARALFESEQVVNGYYTGIDAVNRLDRFLQSASPDTPGYYDARFLLALYSVYTHDLKTRSHWLIGTVESVGNKSQSIKEIVDTIGSKAIFASESARAFLAEVHWRTPEICGYRKLANKSHRFLPQNVDLALLAQGVLLKCGLPGQALSINNRYHNQSNLPDPVRVKMLKARLRISADLGDTAAIQTLDLLPGLEHYRALALANALDVSASRTAAITQYQSLLNNTSVIEQIRRAAKVRLTYPYQPPTESSETANDIAPGVCNTP